MENLTLENGRAQSRSHLGSQIRMGGAIFVSRSALTIISSTFKNNKAAGGVGGAIYSDFSTLNITDSNFTDNDAAEGKSIYIQGGNGAYILNSIIDERDIANEPDWDNNDKLAQITILNDLNATLYIRSHVKGEDTTLNIIEPENLICIANLTIDSHQENNVQITNGQASINLNLDYGSHTATMTTPNIEYYADSTRNLTCTYLAASTTSNEFMVLKTVDIQLTVQNITYGEAETVTAHIDAQGNATIRLDGAIIKESIDINNKKIEYSIPMQYLTAGTHTFEVTYNGDAYTSNSSKSAEFTVYKANVTLKIEMKSEITIGETQTIKIMVDNENATGNVIIDIAGEKYTANMTKGIANFKMPTLNIGAYKITFAYQGDRNLNDCQATAALTVKDKTSSNSGNIPKKTRYPVEIYLTLKNVKKVSKKAAKLYLTVIVKRNGKKLTTKRITVKLKMNNVKTKKSTKLKNFRFLVKVNGKTYIQKPNKKGKATYRITNLYNKGTYTAKITCKSNKYYNIGKAKFKIER